MGKQNPTLNRNFLLNFTCLVCFGLAFQLEMCNASSIECGTVELIIPQVVGGKQALRGEWPFIAAIFKIEKHTLICGGTIISIKHILTGKDNEQCENLDKQRIKSKM